MVRAVGIDPGKTGGAALIVDKRLVEAVPLPLHGKELAALLRRWRPTHLYIEKVQGRGGWAATANFNFGAALGRIQAVVEVLELPHTLVPPQSWQKVALAGMDRRDPKAAAALRFQQLFPSYELSGNKQIRMGLIDAALIAWYGA